MDEDLVDAQRSTDRPPGYWSELRAWLLRDPGKLIRYVVLFVCSIVVIVQLYECFTKLLSPPITTHSYYDLNETIEMPAITICRDPPYKEDVLTQLSDGYCPHPKYASCWINYPFGQIQLNEFFMNSTFDLNETFYQYGLNGDPNNLQIDDSLHFYMGRCHTVRPNIAMKRVSKAAGYSLMLTHHVPKSPTMDSDYASEPGWHVFIHDNRENFTEVNMKGSGRVEYVFVEINESIEIKLQTQYFSRLETPENSCSRAEGYSDLKCCEVRIWQDLADDTNCSGPWMQNIIYESCNDSKAMRGLITNYKEVYEGEDVSFCDCTEPCESRIFSTYIQSRKAFTQPEPRTQIFIYYTTKLISVIQEYPSYDTSQFIADVGGSLGFLLGLSVLGVIGVLEYLTLFFCGSFIKRMQQQYEKRKQSKMKMKEEESQICGDASAEIAVISKIY